MRHFVALFLTLLVLAPVAAASQENISLARAHRQTNAQWLFALVEREGHGDPKYGSAKILVVNMGASDRCAGDMKLIAADFGSIPTLLLDGRCGVPIHIGGKQYYNHGHVAVGIVLGKAANGIEVSFVDMPRLTLSQGKTKKSNLAQLAGALDSVDDALARIVANEKRRIEAVR